MRFYVLLKMKWAIPKAVTMRTCGGAHFYNLETTSFLWRLGETFFFCNAVMAGHHSSFQVRYGIVPFFNVQ